MASELTAADVSHRLADQLQVLSQVAETLTYRLLDLEERLAGQELQLQPFLQGGSLGSGLIAEGTDQRLAETEDRLSRLESLLQAGLAADAAPATSPATSPEAPGAQPGEEVRHLRSVASAPISADAEDLDRDDLDVRDLDSRDLDSGDLNSEDLDSEDPEFELAHLEAAHLEAAQPAHADELAGAEDPYDADPFLEEHEQPFMDELSA
jgi:hypothetical protein